MGLSGKSDFEDMCSMHHNPEEILERYQIYARPGDVVPLKMESQKDLVAYYPYLVTMMYSNKEEGGCIYLSEQSYIDTDEQNQLEWRLRDAKKYYRYCKRKKIPFDKNEALKKIIWLNDDPRQFEIDIVDEVAKYGNKATIKDIHDPMHDRMREKWYKLMVNSGWDEERAYRWVYGWSRWLEKNIADEFGENTIQMKLDIKEQ